MTGILFTIAIQLAIVCGFLGYIAGMLSAIHKRLSQILTRYCVKNGYSVPAE